MNISQNVELILITNASYISSEVEQSILDLCDRGNLRFTPMCCSERNCYLSQRETLGVRRLPTLLLRNQQTGEVFYRSEDLGSLQEVEHTLLQELNKNL